MKEYKKDLQFFMNLRKTVQLRYAEVVNFKDYEPRIRKLVDQYVSVEEGAMSLNDPVDIFNQEEFREEVERAQGKAAKADTIAHRTKRSIDEKMEEDPAFYLPFSKMIKDLIERYRLNRISEQRYLKETQEIMEKVVKGRGEEVPEKLKNHKGAQAFYGLIQETLQNPDYAGQVREAPPAYGSPKSTRLAKEEILVDLAIQIDRIVLKHRIINWVKNPDIQNNIRNEIDDTLYQLGNKHEELAMSHDQMDRIIENSINIAKKRYS